MTLSDACTLYRLASDESVRCQRRLNNDRHGPRSSMLTAEGRDSLVEEHARWLQRGVFALTVIDGIIEDHA